MEKLHFSYHCSHLCAYHRTSNRAANSSEESLSQNTLTSASRSHIDFIDVPSDDEEVDDESEDEDSQDFEADIDAKTSTAEDFARWKCPSCNQISPLRKKPCGCVATKRIRMCSVPDCLKFSRGSQCSNMCITHFRNATAGEMVATPPNLRRQSKNVSPARLKNPHANLKRRDAPRRRSRHHCGSCDACMVDDCGECSYCLDKPRFGGNGRSRQNCMTRPPCYDQQSALNVIPRATDNDLEEMSDKNTRNHSRKRRRKNDDDSQNGESIEAADEAFARWKCHSCERVGVAPLGKKLCSCSAPRRRLCGVPDCPLRSQGSQYNHLCAHHYKFRTSEATERNVSSDEEEVLDRIKIC